MSSLLNLLLGSMTSNSSVSSVSKKTGLSDKVVSALVAAAIPLLLKSLTSNASSSGGLSSLMGALTQHTSKKSIDEQILEADVDDGKKIVGHIFGDNTQDVIGQLSAQTGLASDQVTSVLGNIAPALMSSLSAATTAGKQETLPDASSLGGLSDLVGSLFGGGSFGAKPSAPNPFEAKPAAAQSSEPKPAAAEASEAKPSGGIPSILGGATGAIPSILGGAKKEEEPSSGISSFIGSLFGGAKEEEPKPQAQPQVQPQVLQPQVQPQAASSKDDGTDLLSALLGFKF